MTYLEEAKLEAIYNGDYNKQYGHSKYRAYDDCAIDYDRDKYHEEGSSGNSFSHNSMHFE